MTANCDQPQTPVTGPRGLDDRIRQLRVAGDAEEVARLLLDRAGTDEERRAVRPNRAEVEALKRLKKERRLGRKHQEARDTLEWLRAAGQVYRLAYLVTRPDELYRDLVSGANLPPGITRFELREAEVEAIRLRQERRFDRGVHPIEWKYLGDGSYQTLDGRWTILRCGFNEWWLYWDDEPVGGWGDRPHWPYGRKYYPFRTVWEAKEWAEEHPDGEEGSLAGDEGEADG